MNLKTELSPIYVEVITVGKNYRVSITDEEDNSTHPLLPLFDEYEKAETYAKKINQTLLRFAGKFRNLALTPKGN